MLTITSLQYPAVEISADSLAALSVLLASETAGPGHLSMHFRPYSSVLAVHGYPSAQGFGDIRPIGRCVLHLASVKPGVLLQAVEDCSSGSFLRGRGVFSLEELMESLFLTEESCLFCAHGCCKGATASFRRNVVLYE